MDADILEQLKYPIGKFIRPEKYNSEIINNWIETISNFPEELKNVVIGLTELQLDTPYRPKGWTVRQVVHHCADSHMNAFIRFKLALTEDKPVIKPYEEQLWAEQTDYNLPLNHSLAIIEGLHHRWTILLKSMNIGDFEKTYIHPAQNKEFDLKDALGQYDWHCRHHLGHIKGTLLNI